MASAVAREPVEARARGPTGSPAALSAPITSAAVEKEIRSILLGLIPTCVLTGKPDMRGGGQRTQPLGIRLKRLV